MAEFETPPTFNLKYDVAPTDIGAGYAKGITEAGTSLAGAISQVSQTMTENKAVSDTLGGLYQAKMLTPDQYNAVLGKSPGAQKALLGQFMANYTADQALRRDQALAQGKGAVDIATEHAKLLDMINQWRSGMGPGKTAYVNPQGGATNAQATTTTNPDVLQAPGEQPLYSGGAVPNANTNVAALPSVQQTGIVPGKGMPLPGTKISQQVGADGKLHVIHTLPSGTSVDMGPMPSSMTP
jgi:hypothetical protein